MDRWRGGTEPAEARQAIETVRLFVEQYGESRFEPLDDLDPRPVNSRAGWRKGTGSDREWMVPPEVWKSEICAGLDSTMVARVLSGRGMLLRAADGFQPVRKSRAANKRVYILTASIFDGGGDEACTCREAAPINARGIYPENWRSWRNGRSGGSRYVCEVIETTTVTPATPRKR